MADITALLLDTLSFTLTLLLVTLGLVVIFGMMNVINMAHGEFFLIGAYVVVFVTGAGGSFWLGLLLAPIVLAILGFGLEWLVIRHIYHRFIDTILATWGISLALKQSITIIFGPGSQSVPNPLPGSLDLLGIDYPIYRLFIMAIESGACGGHLSRLVPHAGRTDGARRHCQPCHGGIARHQYATNGLGDLRLWRRARRLCRCRDVADHER